MAKQEYSDYQKKVISNYFNNIDTIMLGRLSELVSELYLAETEAHAKKLWERVEKAMVKLNVPDSIVNHIMEKKDVKILAKNIQEWQNKS